VDYKEPGCSNPEDNKAPKPGCLVMILPTTS
jgi:hypothetical protein